MAFYSFDRRIINPSIKPWGTFYPWTPARITTALWLDAADSDTVTLVGSGVSEWKDKSGNNRHTYQGTSSARPLLVYSGIGGNTSIRFSTDDWLDTGLTSLGNTSLFAHSGQRFFVFVVAAGTGDGTMFAKAAASTRTFQMFFGGTVFYVISRGETTDLSDARPSGGAVYGVTWNGSTLNRSYNGNTGNLSVGTASEQTSERVIIGARTNGTAYYFNGDISEIVVGDATITTIDRQKLEGYLAHKFGLSTNLPSYHPYKTRAPRA